MDNKNNYERTNSIGWWERVNAALGTTLARSRPLTLKYTLEASAAINLLTSLVGNDLRSYSNQGVLLAAFYFMTAAVFTFSAQGVVERFENSANSIDDLKSQLRNRADDFGWPFFTSLFYVGLATVSIVYLAFARGK